MKALGNTVAIVQSSYIPWKGYFDLLRRSDIFILYDNVQYTRRDWRNRNIIKTPQGPIWLSIPVKVKGKYHQLISEVETVDQDWPIRHWKTIEMSYRSAPYFEEMRLPIHSLFEECRSVCKLSDVNSIFINGLAKLIGLNTTILRSSDYKKICGKTENLVQLCMEFNAHTYLSGPSAKNYLDESLFESSGINVHYMDYSKYPTYPQLHGAFDHQVSIIDLLMNTGYFAAKYIDDTNP